MRFALEYLAATKPRPEAGAPFIGKEDAPLTMAYWFDYQCPFCKKYDMPLADLAATLLKTMEIADGYRSAMNAT